MIFSKKRTLRSVSLFVLASFVSSLTAPVFASGSAAAPSGSAMADKMTAASTKGLSNLWFVWGDHLKNFKGPKAQLTPSYAAQFFQAQGATAAQAEVLVNNARSTGQLSVGAPSGASAIQNLMAKAKGLFTKAGTPKGAEVKVAQSTEVKAPSQAAKTITEVQAGSEAAKTGLVAKTKSFFSRLIPGKGASASSAAASGSNSSASASGTSAKAASANPSSASAGAPGGAQEGLLGSLTSKVKSVAAKTGQTIKAGVDRVSLGARRGAAAVGTTAQTGYLSTKYFLDPRPYYEIPIHGETAIKFRGTHKSTVAFKEGKWTVKDFSYKSSWPTKADLATRVDSMSTSQNAQPKGLLGKVTAKFKGLADSVRTRLRGEANIKPETRAEIQRLELNNHMIDQARSISDAQRALRVRIDQMKHSSQSLQRPLDADKVKAMESQIKNLEKTKNDLLKKASGSMDGKATAVMKDAAKWALYSVGITASVNLIRQAASGEGLDVGKAFSFLAEPSFWGGTAGGFLGSTVVTALTSGLFPGAGPFLKFLPGFLGAAFGFEFGSSLFGGQMDLFGTLVTTLASAGGHALAISVFGAPGIAAVGAAIAAGALAGFILDKFRGGPESEHYILPDGEITTMASEDATVSAEVNPLTEDKASMATDSVQAVNVAAAKAQRDRSYEKYVSLMKARKIPEATAAHKAYMDAEKIYDMARKDAVANLQ